jgi:hypothetical protein
MSEMPLDIFDETPRDLPSISDQSGRSSTILNYYTCIIIRATFFSPKVIASSPTTVS